jgi:hypothetical protein
MSCDDSLSRMLALVLAGALSACAAGPAEMATEGRSAMAAPGARAASPVAAFERQYREQAAQAAALARWADALWAWDVVLALKPDDAEATVQRERAQRAAQAAVAEREPRAREAQQRGDADTATRLWLEVLSLAPEHAAAADALRQIERQRARRQNVAGGFRAGGPRPARPLPEAADVADAVPPARPKR